MNPKHLYKTEILYPLKNSWKYPPLRPCLASSSMWGLDLKILPHLRPNC